MIFFSNIKKGVFYNPDFPELNDKAEQLILVYVTYNDAIVDLLFLLQPEGGLFPLVLLQPWSKRVKLEMDVKMKESYSSKLIKYYNSKLGPALDLYKRDLYLYCFYIKIKIKQFFSKINLFSDSFI